MRKYTAEDVRDAAHEIRGCLIPPKAYIRLGEVLKCRS